MPAPSRVLAMLVAMCAVAGCSSAAKPAAPPPTTAAAGTSAPATPAPTASHSLTAAQLQSALLVATDITLPDGFSAAPATSGTTTADDATDSSVMCPGVGSVIASPSVGDPKASVAFVDAAQDSLSENVENEASPADALKKFTSGVGLIDQCKTVTAGGTTFTVTKLAVPAGLGAAQAAYQFAGTENDNPVTIGIGVCIVGATEVTIGEFAIAGSGIDPMLLTDALTKAVAKVKAL